MKKLLSIILFGLGLVAGLKHATAATPGATTASTPDLTCRVQAKEVAKQTYNDCMGEAKAAQAEQIRKEYQLKLKNLKAQYQRDLKKTGVASKAATKAATAPTKTAKATKKTVATPVHVVPEDAAIENDGSETVETISIAPPESSDTAAEGFSDESTL